MSRRCGTCRPLPRHALCQRPDVASHRAGPTALRAHAVAVVRRLRTAEQASLYSLEFRVSLDGYTAAENDPVRGAGT